MEEQGRQGQRDEEGRNRESKKDNGGRSENVPSLKFQLWMQRWREGREGRKMFPFLLTYSDQFDILSADELKHNVKVDHLLSRDLWTPVIARYFLLGHALQESNENQPITKIIAVNKGKGREK